MKTTFAKYLLLPIPGVLLFFSACDDSSLPVKKADAGTGSFAQTPGVCKPSACPKPDKGIPCCTPNAECGTDPTGLGLGCTPNPDSVSLDKVCTVKECPKPGFGNPCCTPLGDCGWDPFMNGVFCLQTPPPIDAPAKPLCDLSKCPEPPAGVKACCQLNGECGLDSLGIGLCFPPPAPLCDLEKCPHKEGGPDACCLLNGKCGQDTLGIGFCFPNPPEATCDLSKCEKPPNGIKACCQPDGQCGWDTLNLGICFPPTPPAPDAGPPPPPQTTPPDDPSIDRSCPSYMGIFGPQWGCCSPWGICGQFVGGQCTVALGSQIPNGPPPPPEAGVHEPFQRCTPHTGADGGR